MLWAILVWIVFGLICGALARLLVPGRQTMGVGMTILLGIVGSFLGGFIGFVLFGNGEPLQPSGFIMSVLGAIITLALYLSLSGRKTRHTSV